MNDLFRGMDVKSRARAGFGDNTCGRPCRTNRILRPHAGAALKLAEANLLPAAVARVGVMDLRRWCGGEVSARLLLVLADSASRSRARLYASSLVGTTPEETMAPGGRAARCWPRSRYRARSRPDLAGSGRGPARRPGVASSRVNPISNAGIAAPTRARPSADGDDPPIVLSSSTRSPGIVVSPWRPWPRSSRASRFETRRRCCSAPRQGLALPRPRRVSSSVGGAACGMAAAPSTRLCAGPGAAPVRHRLAGSSQWRCRSRRCSGP